MALSHPDTKLKIFELEQIGKQADVQDSLKADAFTLQQKAQAAQRDAAIERRKAQLKAQADAAAAYQKQREQQAKGKSGELSAAPPMANLNPRDLGNSFFGNRENQNVADAVQGGRWAQGQQTPPQGMPGAPPGVAGQPPGMGPAPGVGGGPPGVTIGGQSFSAPDQLRRRVRQYGGSPTPGISMPVVTEETQDNALTAADVLRARMEQDVMERRLASEQALATQEANLRQSLATQEAGLRERLLNREIEGRMALARNETDANLAAIAARSAQELEIARNQAYFDMSKSMVEDGLDYGVAGAAARAWVQEDWDTVTKITAGHEGLTARLRRANAAALESQAMIDLAKIDDMNLDNELERAVLSQILGRVSPAARAGIADFSGGGGQGLGNFMEGALPDNLRSILNSGGDLKANQILTSMGNLQDKTGKLKASQQLQGAALQSMLWNDGVALFYNIEKPAEGFVESLPFIGTDRYGSVPLPVPKYMELIYDAANPDSPTGKRSEETLRTLGWIDGPQGLQPPNDLADVNNTVHTAGINEYRTGVKLSKKTGGQFNYRRFLPRTDAETDALLQTYISPAAVTPGAFGRGELPEGAQLDPESARRAGAQLTGEVYPTGPGGTATAEDITRSFGTTPAPPKRAVEKGYLGIPKSLIEPRHTPTSLPPVIKKIVGGTPEGEKIRAKRRAAREKEAERKRKLTESRGAYRTPTEVGRRYELERARNADEARRRELERRMGFGP